MAAQSTMRYMATLVFVVLAATAVAAPASAPIIGFWIAADISHAWVVALGTVVTMFAVSGVTLEALPGIRRLVSTVTTGSIPEALQLRSRVGRSGGTFAQWLSGIQKNSSFRSGSRITSVGRPHSSRIALMPRSRMWPSNAKA